MLPVGSILLNLRAHPETLEWQLIHSSFRMGSGATLRLHCGLGIPVVNRSDDHNLIGLTMSAVNVNNM